MGLGEAATSTICGDAADSTPPPSEQRTGAPFRVSFPSCAHCPPPRTPRLFWRHLTRVPQPGHPQPLPVPACSPCHPVGPRAEGGGANLLAARPLGRLEVGSRAPARHQRGPPPPGVDLPEPEWLWGMCPGRPRRRESWDPHLLPGYPLAAEGLLNLGSQVGTPQLCSGSPPFSHTPYLHLSPQDLGTGMDWEHSQVRSVDSGGWFSLPSSPA